MASFEEARKILDDFEIPYRQASEYRGEPPREPVLLDTFTHVHLKLTPEEWCQFCMREGEFYLGGCCGTLSAVQDMLQEAFRDSGEIACKDLKVLAELMISHDGGDEDAEDDDLNISFDSKRTIHELAGQMDRDWDESHPLVKIAFTWHLVKDHYAAEVPREPHNPSPLEEAIVILSNSLSYLWMSRLGDHSGDNASDALALGRLLPALKILNEQIHEKVPNPIEGLMIVSKDQPDRPAFDTMGHSFYQTREDLEKFVILWTQQEEQYQEERPPHQKSVREMFCWRKARVSVDQGIEFLSDPVPV